MLRAESGQQEHGWEQEPLRTLPEEFSVVLAHVDSVVSAHQGSAQDVREIVDFLVSSPKWQCAKFADAKLSRIIAWRTAEIGMGTLEALLASGNIGRIQNAELKSKLAAWMYWVLDAQEKKGWRVTTSNTSWHPGWLVTRF